MSKMVTAYLSVANSAAKNNNEPIFWLGYNPQVSQCTQHSNLLPCIKASINCVLVNESNFTDDSSPVCNNFCLYPTKFPATLLEKTTMTYCVLSIECPTLRPLTEVTDFWQGLPPVNYFKLLPKNLR